MDLQKKFCIAPLFFVLGSIFLLGLFLRVNNAGKNLNFLGDTDRDVLVAKHILLDRQVTLEAPAALLGRGLLANSSIYFYFLALLNIFFKTPEAIALFLTAFSSLTIPLGYLVGKEISNKKIGIILAFFTATNYELIRASQQIYQPDILATISIFASCFLLLGYLRKSAALLCISAALFGFSLHIHYSILSILPAVGIWFIVIPLQFKKKAFLIPAVIFFLLCLFWKWWVSLGATSQPEMFVWVAFSSFLTNFLKTVKEIVPHRGPMFINTLFPDHPSFVWLFILITVLPLTKNIVTYPKKNLSQLLSGPFLLVSLFASILITLFSHEVQSAYYAPYYFLFLVLIAYTIFLLFVRKSSLFFIGIFAIFVSSTWIHKTFAKMWLPFEGLSVRQENSAVAQLILSDLANSSQKDINEAVKDILVIDKVDGPMIVGWAAPSYWYALEESTNQNLVAIDTDFNNIRPRTTTASTYYLVCLQDLLPSSKFIDECLHSFEKEIATNPFYTTFFAIKPPLSAAKPLSIIQDLKRPQVVFRFDRLEK
jgi:hypothetical protein